MKDDESNQFLEAIRILQSGGVIIYPTDTVYGIGCKISAQKAIQRIFDIKRINDKPLSVAFYNLEQLEEYAELDNIQRNFIKEKLRNPEEGYTFVVKKRKGKIDDLVTCGLGTVGARIINYSVVNGFTYIAGPIITTSANLSGQEPVTEAKDLDGKIKQEVDMVYEGRCIYGKPSKIFDLSNFSVLRE